jgi:ankyrin repeat protein
MHSLPDQHLGFGSLMAEPCQSSVMIHRMRRYVLLLLLAVPTCAACSDSESVNAKKAFSEPAAARVAEAVASGDTASVDTLVKSGASPDAIGAQGVSLLQWAMLNQNKPGFDALLAAGADPAHADESGDTVMHYAAKANDVWYLDALLARGVDLNMRNPVTGATPMMSAMIGGRDAQFHKLLAAGADPNLANLSGDTSLHVAAEINAGQIVLELLDTRADPSILNQQHVTFQRYMYMTPANVLSDDARRQRERVTSWLRDHNVLVEDVHR